MKKLKIERHLEGFNQYMGKAETELKNIVEEVRKYSIVSLDDFEVTCFGGDGIGIIPTHLYRDDSVIRCGTYASIVDVINAIKNKEIINDEWFIENKTL